MVYLLTESGRTDDSDILTQQIHQSLSSNQSINQSDERGTIVYFQALALRQLQVFVNYKNLLVRILSQNLGHIHDEIREFKCESIRIRGNHLSSVSPKTVMSAQFIARSSTQSACPKNVSIRHYFSCRLFLDSVPGKTEFKSKTGTG
jgi:hypothetical protein